MSSVHCNSKIRSAEQVYDHQVNKTSTATRLVKKVCVCGFYEGGGQFPLCWTTVGRRRRPPMLVVEVTLSATDCYIVHEIYNGENAQDQFEYELEQALEAQYKYIVIEPTRIGDETARWITVGNCLHKTAVLAGTACLFTPWLFRRLFPLHLFACWRPQHSLLHPLWDLLAIRPCCKYQVEYNAYKLSRLKDDLHRKRLQNTIALAALVYCVKKIYELYAV
uniref:Transmembrane protein 11 n=1 Tax=Podarcis muralis TaxID=64176 RepID=A0A670KKX7_PODMU